MQKAKNALNEKLARKGNANNLNDKSGIKDKEENKKNVNVIKKTTD
jgi:hypothetical protein